MNPRLSLPIDHYLPDIVSHLNQHPSLVLQAAPGSGKTTRVPAALLNAAFLKPADEIWVLEPRRLAARLAAQRVASELGEAVGERVGFQFRFERSVSPRTRLTFLTEGMLMRRLPANPQLTGVRVVMLDEFHERHLHGDVALAYLRRLQKTTRPDLKIVVMSATLDSEAVSTFLGGCRVLRVDARRFEVATDYLPVPPTKPLDVLVCTAVSQLLTQKDRAPGDILVFLPGMAEIRRAQTALDKARLGVFVAPLHGALSNAEQDVALRRADRTKVILSTNVAESSLTIEGVTAVIDSGLERSAGYSHWTGVPTLQTRPISRASADQRAGRAGRTAPGRCLRLYPKRDYESRALFTTAEIQRADLAQTVLELKAMNIPDVLGMEWFESPSMNAVRAAGQLLGRLGALDEQGNLTEVGRQMGRLAAHPRLTRLMIEAGRRGVTASAATLAALIQEGKLEDLDALAQAERHPSSDPVFKRARQGFLDMADQTRARSSSENRDQDLAAAVWTAFPDRVAQKQKTVKPGITRVTLLLSSGGSATVTDASIVRTGNTFIVLDVQERDAFRGSGSELNVRALVPISEDVLLQDSSALTEREEIIWDNSRQRVASVSRLSYGEITLIESAQTPSDPIAAARVLAKEGFHLQPERFAAMSLPEFFTHVSALPASERLVNVAARLDVLSHHAPELEIPPLTAESLGTLVLHALEGFISVAEAGKINIAQAVLDGLPGHARARIDTLTPSTVQLAGGRKATIHYELGKAPWVESRLQDFIGLKQGPAILNGRLPLTLHLLAPNRRPVQITTDLAGFWKRAYVELRPSLSRRYPRHAWPENPYNG